eukprot:GHVU01091569.1.p1 GENE.GHVU01091569.1~~GHVU01091569.1.p1  ORF type:complete len:110 (+),score=10.65 GHVU01091569.1:211-540(+)
MNAIHLGDPVEPSGNRRNRRTETSKRNPTRCGESSHCVEPGRAHMHGCWTVDLSVGSRVEVELLEEESRRQERPLLERERMRERERERETDIPFERDWRRAPTHLITNT